MRKVICILFIIIVFAIAFSGCKSKEEKELERARDTASQLQKQAESAQSSYDSLKRDIDNYNDALSRLEKAK